MRQFLLPDLGMGNKDAEVVAWHVAIGDHVEADTPLVSVETEKATIEIPSPWGGRIARLFANNGDLVKVGAPLVEIDEGAELVAAPVPTRLTATVRKVRAPPSPASPEAVRKFVLPDLGIGDKEAEVIAWYVGVGDHVVADEPLVSIETDKATIELPSPWSGRITRLLTNAGDVVKVGAPLVEIAEGAGGGGRAAYAADEEPAGEEIETRLIQRPVEAVRQRAPAPAPTPIPAPAPTPTPRAPTSTTRALARDLAVDLNRVEATGPDGTVTRADVERAAKKLGQDDAAWGDVKELRAEGSHITLAVALVVIVLCGLFLAWWLDPTG